MKKYVKPETNRVLLDEDICQSADCVKIQEHFNNSGKPMPSDFKFNLQCGNGGYDSSKDNLHAVVEIKAGEAWRINAEADGWKKCAVENWTGAGLCEYQIHNHMTAANCVNKADLVQVFRNGAWENVPVTWYGPKYQGRKLTWVQYN
ncbi:MAG: hypothetical protein Q4D12_06165 [Bacteroidales bacterium]|nr:hypothetical protein [Bacteroidales bacterium]